MQFCAFMMLTLPTAVDDRPACCAMTTLWQSRRLRGKTVTQGNMTPSGPTFRLFCIHASGLHQSDQSPRHDAAESSQDVISAKRREFRLSLNQRTSTVNSRQLTSRWPFKMAAGIGTQSGCRSRTELRPAACDRGTQRLESQTTQHNLRTAFRDSSGHIPND